SVPLAAIQPPASALINLPSLTSLSLPLMPAPPLGVVIQSSGKPGKAANIRTIILGNGTELKLTLAEIPDPPAVSFIDNIPQLNQMCDDTSIHWRKDSRLHIRGEAITLSCW
ncbi:hypothetical protein L208DRAFT_1066683, partial [Tricholoma matsutake]